MSFFFHGEWGAAYFVALIAICAFAILRGGKDLRLFAYCLLGVFFADRILLATMDNETLMIGLGGALEFIALISSLTTSKIGQFIAFCFVAKIMMYISLIANFISFDTMAAWSELAGYGQLLIIAGGALNADRGKLASRSRVVRSGNSSYVSFSKKRVQDE